LEWFNPQSFTETLEMIDANPTIYPSKKCRLGTMLSHETRVPSEVETIERTALVFRTG